MPVRARVDTARDARPPRRDPARKQRILASAAQLIARSGYHSVSLADIGAEAGIVGSGVYRHFDSKASVLVALFDEVINALAAQATGLVESAADADADEVLGRLIANHVEFALAQRLLLRVYHQEIRNLPDEDRTRLSRKQRLYLEEWVHVELHRRPGLGDARARFLVHAAIGAIHSVLFYSSGLDQHQAVDLLTAAAWSCLDSTSN